MKASLKATIAELITATEIAERAIGGLKLTVRDVNENLSAQLTAAGADLDTAQEAACRRRHGGTAAVQDRERRASFASGPAPEPAPTVSSARAIAQAAQEFSERRRSNGLAA